MKISAITFLTLVILFCSCRKEPKEVEPVNEDTEERECVEISRSSYIGSFNIQDKEDLDYYTTTVQAHENMVFELNHHARYACEEVEIYEQVNPYVHDDHKFFDVYVELKSTRQTCECEYQFVKLPTSYTFKPTEPGEYRLYFTEGIGSYVGAVIHVK